MEVRLPVGFAGFATLLEKPVPLGIYPGLDTGECAFETGSEQVCETALTLEPRHERKLVVGPVGEAILAVFILEQGPVASVHSLAGKVDALCSVGTPATRARRKYVFQVSGMRSRNVSKL